MIESRFSLSHDGKMKKLSSKFMVAMVFGLVGMIGSALAESTRPTYPTVFGLEALGRASTGSVFFDRMLDENFAAGIGYGGGPISMLPVYGNYYLSSDQGSLYLTGGISAVLNYDSIKGRKTALGDWTVNQSVLPMFGLGYENRSDQGYLFRLTGYGIYAAKVFQFWGGLSLGFAF